MNFRKLGEECCIIMGQSPQSKTYNTKKEGIAFLQGRKTFGRMYPHIDTWTTQPIKIGKKDAILMSVRAPVGDVNIAKEEICIGRGLASISMKNKHNLYLYYLLLNNINHIKNKSAGTVFEAINKSDLENLRLRFHNEKDQSKIEKILGTIDEKIELNNQINDNLLEFGIKLFKEELNYSNHIETLQNIIKFVKGKKPKAISNIKKDDYEKYLTIACLNAQELNYADTTKMILSNNDLLMVMDGASSGEVYYGGQGIVGSTLARIDCMNNQYICEFIYFAMRYYRKLIQSKNTGSAIPHTDKTFVSTLKIPTLDYNQQEKYKVMLAKIQKNSQENENLKQLRDTLLPKLMDGKIDLDKIKI